MTHFKSTDTHNVEISLNITIVLMIWMSMECLESILGWA